MTIKMCEGCGLEFEQKRKKAKFCSRDCATNCLSGHLNGNWRGGHKHWSPGRLGKDKDGLSWRIQRRLAWERDNFTCQHCGKVPKRKPDVHHIDPWMNSMSHALENLICLCQSCHLKEEAKVQEKWGGHVTPPVKKVEKAIVTCPVCGNILLRVGRGQDKTEICQGICDCLRAKTLEMRGSGVAVKVISLELNVSERTVYYILARSRVDN